MNKKNILGSLKFLFFYLIIFAIYSTLDSNGQILVLSFAFPLILFFFYVSLLHRAYPLISIYSVFFVFLISYNAGHFLNLILGAPTNSIAHGYFSIHIISEAGFFCFSFLSFLHVFFLLFCPSTKNILRKSNISIQDSVKERAILITGILLLSLSIIPYLWMIYNAISIVKTYGYAQYWYIRMYMSEKIIPTELSALTSFVVPGLLMVYIGSKKRMIHNLMIFFLIFNFLLFTVIGLRSKAVLPMFSFLICYYYLKRKLSIKKFNKVVICIGIAFLFYIPLAAEVRSYSRSFAFNRFIDNISISENLRRVFDETGVSFIGIPYTMQNVPSNKSFWLGKSYILPFFDSLPYLTASRLFSLNIIENLPFVWFNKSFDPERYEIGGGWGYSVIAEAYANFGLYSLLVVTSFLAFSLVKLDVSLFNRKVSFFSSYAILSIPYILFLSRSSFDVSIRSIINYAVLPIFFSFLIYICLIQNKKGKRDV